MTEKIILCFDDDFKILSFLSATLNREGYTVFTSENSPDALNIIDDVKPDLIILDVNMPKKSGYDVCKDIRANEKYKHISILFLTAQVEDDDEITGLQLGADDYIHKPCSVKKLSLKVSIMLKQQERFNSVQTNTRLIEYKGISLDRNAHIIKIDGKVVKFLAKEFRLLTFLLAHPNIAFSRKEILQKVWEDDIMFTERTIDVHITKLRQKIAPYNTFIETISGVGYKFNMDMN